MHHTSPHTARSPLLAYLLFSLLFLSAAAALLSLYMLLAGSDTDATALSPPIPSPSLVVVIDAGHGGEDGGAPGYVDGAPICEKDINLHIALTLAALLREDGVEVVLTREEDTLLYDRSTDYQGRKKALDMAARLAVAERAAEGGREVVFVSIHQNTFTDPRYCGLQVYHSPHHADSARLAEIIQTTARQQLAPDNDRRIKEGGEIYLLAQLHCPAVLVECGFLSHPEECAALATEEYRNRVAYAIFCALREYRNGRR